MKNYKDIDVCALNEQELEALKVELLNESKETVVDFLTFLIDEKVPNGDEEIKVCKESISNIVELIKDPRFKEHLDVIVPPDSIDTDAKSNDGECDECISDCECDEKE